MALIRRYAQPDRRGWLQPPADIYYKLTRWHQLDITREQLAEVLRSIRDPRPRSG